MTLLKLDHHGKHCLFLNTEKALVLFSSDRSCLALPRQSVDTQCAREGDVVGLEQRTFFEAEQV